MEKYNRICWLKSFIQFILTAPNIFSLFMVAFIALDRYLHMRYLERYPSIVTKKRGYLLAITSFLFASTASAIIILPLPRNAFFIIQWLFIVSVFPVLLSIMILYYSAMKTLRAKARQLTRLTISQTTALSNAAKRITICVAVLMLPLFIIEAIELANEYYEFVSSSLMDDIKWFAYITYLFNIFGSSFIFMSQNRPIKTVLRRFGTNLCIRASSTVTPINT